MLGAGAFVLDAAVVSAAAAVVSADACSTTSAVGFSVLAGMSVIEVGVDFLLDGLDVRLVSWVGQWAVLKYTTECQ